MKKEVILNQMVIAGATIAAGFLMNEVIRRSWQAMTNEETPAETPDSRVDWKKAALYTFLTGTLIGAVKTATQRGMTVYLSKQGQEVRN